MDAFAIQVLKALFTLSAFPMMIMVVVLFVYWLFTIATKKTLTFEERTDEIEQKMKLIRQERTVLLNKIEILNDKKARLLMKVNELN